MANETFGLNVLNDLEEPSISETDPGFLNDFVGLSKRFQDQFANLGLNRKVFEKLSRLILEINQTISELKPFLHRYIDPINLTGCEKLLKLLMSNEETGKLDIYSIVETLEKIVILLKREREQVKLKRHKKAYKHISPEARSKIRASLKKQISGCERIALRMSKTKAMRDEMESRREEVKNLFKETEHYSSVCEAVDLLTQDSFEPQARALEILAKCKLTAGEGYDKIHKGKNHLFSERFLPSNHALNFIKSAGIDGSSNLLEIGCGMGNDSFAFALNDARVFSLDNSKVAEEGFQKQLDEYFRYLSNPPEKEKISRNMEFLKMDFSRVVSLDEMIRQAAIDYFKGLELTHIYSNSSLHYYPDKVLLKVFEALYEILKGRNGTLGLAMKTVISDSAGRDRQIRLKGRKGLYLSFDRVDQMPRVYPADDQTTKLLEEGGFENIETTIVKAPGFDIGGQTEDFSCISAKAA